MTDAGSPRAQRLALVALLFGAVAIGCSPIFVRLSELGPVATAFHRVFLALPVLWMWNRAKGGGGGAGGGAAGDRRRPATASDYGYLFLAGALFAGDLIFWHWSIANTSVANATLLANFAPIFVTLGGFLFFGERFSRTFLLGLGLGLAGATILLGGSFVASRGNLLGDFYGLVTAFFFGSYILTVGRLRAHFPTATIMLVSSAATAAILLPATWLAGQALVPATLYGWAVLVGLALFSHAAGQGGIAYALAHLPAAFSSVGLLVEPAVAAALAWIILDEALGPFQAIGAAVIVAGILIARRGSR